MRFTKLILLSAIAISLSFATYSEENKEDCSEIKNIYKKLKMILRKRYCLL